jgi:hypothetical protein
MPVGEITAAITSVNAALNIAKAMMGLRDAEMMRSKSIDLQAAILDSLGKAIEAKEAEAAQSDKIRALEAEIAKLKAWDGEEEKYELKKLHMGAMAYMLKPDARGAEPAHWLCPNCFANKKKAFFQPLPTAGYRRGNKAYSLMVCGRSRC